MVHFVQTLGLVLSVASVFVSANPIPTPPPDLKNAVALQKRASCTFTAASAASKSKKDCGTIVLDNIAVPSGTTLDLTDLESGTHASLRFPYIIELLINFDQVIFEGETTWGYEEWSGPLFSVSGEDITVTGASGHSLNGDGSKWWDGEGSNGGKTKPKFFYAHSLTGTSSITGLNILNTPVQVFSVDSSTGLTISNVTIGKSHFSLI